MKTGVMMPDEVLAPLPGAEPAVRGQAGWAQAYSRDVCADRAALTLVRRAVVGGENAAWEALQDRFGPQVRGWCCRSGAAAADLDELVQGTWVRFWQSYTPTKFARASSLSQVLQYLKLCARSTVLDAVRRRRAATELDGGIVVADPQPTPAEQQLEAEERAALWRLVKGHLRDERERILVLLTYELGLTSAEVQAQRPDLFPTVQDVYRVTRNVLDRLRRSPQLRAWYAVEG